jgi:uncharacterized protein
MLPEILDRKTQLEQICRRYRVRRLELFGSAVSGGDRAQVSDLDFLAEFEPLPPGDYADAGFYPVSTDSLETASILRS